MSVSLEASTTWALKTTLAGDTRAARAFAYSNNDRRPVDLSVVTWVQVQLCVADEASHERQAAAARPQFAHGTPRGRYADQRYGPYLGQPFALRP